MQNLMISLLPCPGQCKLDHIPLVLKEKEAKCKHERVECKNKQEEQKHAKTLLAKFPTPK